MQPRSRDEAKTVPYRSSQETMIPDDGYGVFEQGKRWQGLLFGALAVLITLISSGGVYLISREAQFQRLQNDVGILEEEVERLRSKQRDMETEDARLRTKIENLTP